MTVKTLIPTKNLNEIYDIDNRASLNGDIILDFGFDLDVDKLFIPKVMVNLYQITLNSTRR